MTMTADQAMVTISRGGQALGFLDALDALSKLSPATGHPVETETLKRIYNELQQRYVERYRPKGGAACK